MNKQRGDAEMLVILSLFGIVIGGFLGLGFGLDHRACRTRAELMRLDYRWGPNIGCMVRVDDRWAPIEYIRIVDGKVSIQGDGQ